MHLSEHFTVIQKACQTGKAAAVPSSQHRGQVLQCLIQPAGESLETQPKEGDSPCTDCWVNFFSSVYVIIVSVPLFRFIGMIVAHPALRQRVFRTPVMVYPAHWQMPCKTGTTDCPLPVRRYSTYWAKALLKQVTSKLAAHKPTTISGLRALRRDVFAG